MTNIGCYVLNLRSFFMKGSQVFFGQNIEKNTAKSYI